MSFFNFLTLRFDKFEILKFFGSTLDYGQNSRGDWTVITITKWPLIPIGVAVILWTTWNAYIYVIFFQQGKEVP